LEQSAQRSELQISKFQNDQIPNKFQISNTKLQTKKSCQKNKDLACNIIAQQSCSQKKLNYSTTKKEQQRKILESLSCCSFFVVKYSD
jgi:hypothetical protein